MQKSVLAGTLAAFALFATWDAFGQENRPLLGPMQAMMEANRAWPGFKR